MRSAPALLVLAALVASALPQPCDARGGDTLAGASKKTLATLRKAFRTDESLHAGALRTLAKDLKAGRTTPAEAFGVHASALAYLLEKTDATTDAAAAEFVRAASDAVEESGDPELPGAAPGDGGSLDRFTDSVRKELDRLRSRTTSRVRTFTKTLVKVDGGTSTVRTVIEPLEFDLPAVPAEGGGISFGEEGIRLRALSAARLADGRVFVLAAGTADPAQSGEFDVRLRGTTVETPGPRLADGGVPVSAGGVWSFSVEMGDPFHGPIPLPGPYVVLFGVDPYDDGGGAGRQPQRYVRAGLLNLP